MNTAGSIRVTLPDGRVLPFESPKTGLEVAAAIGPRLARDALVIRVDGELRDLSHRIERDCKIEIVTRTHRDALEVVRHDAAHVLAQAVKELFPSTQITFGPAIENGFYYDFARDTPFTPDDFPAIEQRMREIVDRDLPLAREIWDRDKAIAYFKSIGEQYKAQHIESLPREVPISIYRQGEWLDLCVGPHLASTGKLGKAFKLMKVAGAYWRGDQNNAQLQRVYGTAWPSEAELKTYLTQLEEAEKRDHRRIGREMSLFHVQEEAAGSVFWHPKGWVLYRQCESYLRRKLEAAGYQEIKTPQLVDRALWEASGHWEKFRENMYTAESEDRIYALKPMNCPGAVQIFRQGQKSYRDLPLRLAEFGSCHRYEPSGALHGIMRVRAFTQDDAHIFCTEDQIVSESQAFCDLLRAVYRDFGFTDVAVKFSDRPLVRAGSDAIWDKAEASLERASLAAGLAITRNPGEGAFYGPKLEFILRDAIGRDWQCGTLQVDFVLPERLDANYVGEDGAKHRPVMLHRAIFGSFERFIGILTENYAGRFPLWLAPVQAVVTTIVSDADEYAGQVLAELRAAGLRAEIDLRNEKIGYKVREHSLAHVPNMLVVGKREAERREIALRRLGSNQSETLALDQAVVRLRAEAAPPG
jgi:threonyl-tRNA synthetase